MNLSTSEFGSLEVQPVKAGVQNLADFYLASYAYQSFKIFERGI